MSGVTTRSRSKTKNGNGVADNNGINGVRNGHGAHRNGHNGCLNGFHQNNTHGQEELGSSKMVDWLLNKLFFPVCLIICTPNLVVLFWYVNAYCGGSYGEMVRRLYDGSFVHTLIKIWSGINIVNRFTVGVVFGYMGYAILFMRILPGKTIKGPITPKGNTPIYKDNGFLHYCVMMASFGVLTFVLKMYNMTPTVVYDRFGELIAFMNFFALIFVLMLYFKGKYFPSSTDSGVTGGGFLFDYYWGTELYPRIFGIDVKVFTNCRFGMTVWPLLVCIYALKSYELHGFVDSMFVSTVLQLAYITKFFTWEGGYMHTIDIILDRAGYYICWGCLAWLPALYPLISYYLVSHPVHLGYIWTVVVLGLGLLSILVNYLADKQRQDVRSADGKCLVWGSKPRIIRAKYVTDTGDERESVLLASGWWGLSRHFHYIPEILLSFFWSVPAGFDNVLPYTYVIYLIILLVHRSFRDEEKCSKKYGTYWKEYCQEVKYRIVPYVF
ncbi:7-dehydrocholesterol reductase [Mactra antiquata]